MNSQLKTSLILRVLRKYFQLNQTELADIIQVGQGTISKLEKGKLELSAIQWINLCSKFSLDPHAIQTGRIIALEDLEISPVVSSFPGKFKLPKKYSSFMGSTVKTSYPFIKLLRAKLGDKKTSEFFKSIDVDEDYFVIQNLPINIKFIEDIVSQLSRFNFISKKKLNPLFNEYSSTEFHKEFLQKQPENKYSKTRILKNFVKELNKSYEVNSKYTFNSNSSTIQLKNASYLPELNLSQEFLNFRKMYNYFHFTKILPLLHIHNGIKQKDKANGWEFELLHA